MLLPYKIEMVIRRRPWVTFSLILTNVIVFIAVLSIGKERGELLLMEFGFIPDEFRPLCLLTCLFLHGGWLHLIGNLYFLYIYGIGVEERLGRKNYLLVYLGAGFIGSALHMFTVSRFYSDIPCIGASGAISGLLGAFIVLEPRMRIKCVYLWIGFLRPIAGTIKLPAVFVLGMWFLGQLVYGFTIVEGSPGAVSVAFWAHIGGFLAGALTASVIAYRHGFGNLIRGWKHLLTLDRAIRLYNRGRYREAFDIIEALGEDAMVKFLKGMIYRKEGKTQEAVVFVNEALSVFLRQKNSEAAADAYYLLSGITGKIELTPAEHLVLGKCVAQIGNLNDAQNIFLEALMRFSDEAEAEFLLYELGEVYSQAEKSGQSRQVFELFLKLYPNSKLSPGIRYQE